MAYRGPTIAVPDSSPSSVSGHSPRDTPATKVTHLSPNGTHQSQKISSAFHDATEPPFFHLQQRRANADSFGITPGRTGGLNLDPFMSDSSQSGDAGQEAKRRLSATASVFQPVSASCRTNSLDLSDQRNLDSPASSGESYYAARQYTNYTREDQVQGSLGILDHHSVEALSSRMQDTLNESKEASNQKARMPFDTYFVVGPSRYIMVSGLPIQCPRIYLDALLAVPIIAQSRIAVSDHIVPYGMVMLRYDDVRGAELALTKVRSEFPAWSSGFVTPKCWLSSIKASCEPPANEFEGQVLVTVSIVSPHADVSLAGQENYFASTMHSKLSLYGDVRSVSCMLATITTVALKIEFYSLAAANSPGLENQTSPFPGLRLSVSRYGVKTLPNHPSSLGQASRAYSNPNAAHSFQLNAASAEMQSPAPFHDRMRAGSSARTPRKWLSPLSRALEPLSANHNVVDVERIRRGQDVRTTIMLRNIPNKVDQPMLKEIVDETSRGRYDFMYLRIDFANNCNVGYAFINFEDSQNIIDFVETVAGKRWNRFNSDKVAEVSYATIQGKDCLVQKFRNSSVMLEAPLFRPKIFHTGDGPLAGEEEKFPPPDNQSKMRRSLENAEHVGLFAPRVGQRFRDEQRRRRSRYDRGTRLAEIEEYGQEDEGQNQQGLLAFHPHTMQYPIYQQPVHAVY